MRLLLVRHGTSEANLARLIAGHTDTPLSTPQGEREARLLGERLKDERIDIALTSDLRRAFRTAELALEHHRLQLEGDITLRERAWGELESKPIEEYWREFERSGQGLEAYKPEGGESLLDLERRVFTFLDSALKRYQGKTVFVAAHHSVNKCLLRPLLNRGWSEWQDIVQSNACLNIIEFQSPRSARVELLNCTAHLHTAA